MRTLIYERTGIFMTDEKIGMLSNRLQKRLKALGLDSFDEYYTLLFGASQCEEELPHFLSAVTTNETYFFRNEQLWKHLTRELIPYRAETKPAGRRSLRLWSATSSVYEEADSAAFGANHKPREQGGLVLWNC